jgi:hypothetical protein
MRKGEPMDDRSIKDVAQALVLQQKEIAHS